ncbi:hypothetical protein SERLA73DRAFT_175445 [Serpula lacrymans var. lacrymans S7.3]|uniref:Uncharacterized protein n=2 Tax=Serpula lacrymans var. lacrymans TaxID=341189 RepID=F8PJX3_SERL3|nr:uncharacterized protein SERLADRAFT_457716 [Serpula lacrymans var. lacrymans S7.9]EGO03795.1 hypothetical protein SERLA73DRAFT_175445 [Serpula lacrymans var. lacrymans S7.3]EGO29657.1 hypothetical protein SERLADRAFT_457716 [Serpula lacrymans var. lacrymans S7.9]
MQPAISPKPIPAISISLAPPQDPIVEPFSPFQFAKADQDDGYRPQHLTPPPTSADTRFPRQSSPLRPQDCQPSGKGLESGRFNDMLKATRERQSVIGTRKVPDLRKELAIKNHRSKQVERRALFLSKIQAPPSPTAVYTPKTPPESPSLLHYTMPSPGLSSPLSLFECATEDNQCLSGEYQQLHDAWVEQVDFRLPRDAQSKSALKTRTNKSTVVQTKSTKSAARLPSLDYITARMGIRGVIQNPVSKVDEPLRSSRLPAFLQSRAAPEVTHGNQDARPQLSVGRLHMPLRTPSPIIGKNIADAKPSVPPPASPRAPLTPKLEVTTMVVPRTCNSSPVALSETNLHAFGRAYAARDMLSTIRRRSPPPCGEMDRNDEEERKVRRHSSPAELPKRTRLGFEHAVLALPGGF